MSTLAVTTLVFSDTTTMTTAVVPAGAVGGGTDKLFWQNDTVMTADYTITSTKNAGTFGPVTINSGVTVTIPSGSVWSIV